MQNRDSERSKVCALFGAITSLYRKEHLQNLEHSTRQTNSYLLKNYIEPKFDSMPLRDVTALAVSSWLAGLTLAPSTKSSIRSVLRQCFELAALHEYIPPVERNPMSLVKLRGTSKRQKQIAEISIPQFQRLITSLPEPVNVMTLVAGGLGLRISELVALQWKDIDWRRKQISIQRKFTHGALGITKTASSEAILPLDEGIIAVLRSWNKKVPESEWLFPSSRTGGVRSASMLLQKDLKPVVKELGLGRVTWHTLRHACRSWLSGAGVAATTQKDLLRHSDLGMTLGYGKTPSKDMRRAHAKIAAKLVPKAMIPK
jgi:integrase